jgi:cyclophilin family peptidyl-prolyl cis-trans isomerase
MGPERGNVIMKISIKLFLGAILFLASLMVVSCGEKAAAPSATAPQTAPEVKIMKWDSPPKMQIDTNKKYTATMETDKGTMVLELFAKDVPKTVNNFVFLTRQGFYDGTTFHRVIPGFMAQGGDPTGTGSGGPGYIFANEITSHKHVAGAISMANAGANTNGSQFFICYVAQPSLDGSYSVFGQLTQGMDVLKKITPRDPSTAKFTGDKIIKVTIKEE